MTFKDKLRKRAIKEQAVKILWKLNPYQIMIKPLFTEKAHNQVGDLNKYVFKVDLRANKNDVKLAIKLIYWIDAKSINMVSVPYKGRHNRKIVRRAFKKAIITLSKWEKIEFVS